MGNTTIYEAFVRRNDRQVYTVIFETETVEYWGEDQTVLTERLKKTLPLHLNDLKILWIKPLEDTLAYVTDKK